MGRRIYSTGCGKEFYEYALHIVSLFDEMEKKITNWNNTGKLKLGASITIGTHILPEIIKEYRQLYTNRSILIFCMNPLHRMVCVPLQPPHIL